MYDDVRLYWVKEDGNIIYEDIRLQSIPSIGHLIRVEDNFFKVISVLHEGTTDFLSENVKLEIWLFAQKIHAPQDFGF